MSEIETRACIETRSLASELKVDGEYLEGYAIVYDELSGHVSDRNDGRGKVFREVIAKDAFTDSLKGRNVRFVVEHEEKSEYGDTDSGTLILTPDEKGIQFRALVPQYAGHLKAQLNKGIFKGMSFGFTPTEVEWDGDKRIVRKGNLFHVSPTFNPSYSSAKFELKNNNEKLKAHHQKLKIQLGKKIL